MNHNAIRNTHPNVVTIINGDSFDANGNPVAITQSLVDDEVARLQAEHDSKAYARARADAYAPIGDQMDMQYWDSVNGSRTWLDHIEAVKEAHPK
tara:strand:+ start:160 stop:444 length:285 start_codon:yes stop_codon:yes gene_type:complete